MVADAGGTDDADPVIRVENLSYAFGSEAGRREVLADVSMSVGLSEVVLLDGPSGSGKTTLLTLIGTLRRVQRGSIRILGRELASAKPRELLEARRRIRFVFQRHNLIACLTVLENVLSGLALLPGSQPEWDRIRAKAVLDALGLGDRLDTYPEELSGGQQQRVAVARALAGLPDVLIADEPTASLDRSAGRIVMEQMVGLSKTLGCATLISTHDERIMDMADRRLHIEDGRLTAG
ncbi:MAG TPA: ATP-binding cassette domain-containing protein [Stellaceae bacterium]|nr:ATP-binding cassette domain-containing protein [Stellaceae bacterium]